MVEADISDALILGIDVLREQRGKIDLGNDVLEIWFSTQCGVSLFFLGRELIPTKTLPVGSLHFGILDYAQWESSAKGGVIRIFS